METDRPPVRRGWRVRVAAGAVRAVSRASRMSRIGSGSTVGGRIGLLLAPELLTRLGTGRTVVLVTGTNGKTTTTRLIAEALGAADVATNSAGANLPAGLAGALAEAPAGTPAVLEVDERYLGVAAAALQPAVIVVLNVSRDQLDRMSEVRMVAQRWLAVLGRTDATVVANADDPLVVYAARAARRVIWVAAGGVWHDDAYHCPVCDARLDFAVDEGGRPTGWRCGCGFARPRPEAVVDDERLVLADGSSYEIALSLPGRFNRANAACAAIAARELGVEIEDALAAAKSVETVAGRYATLRRHGRTIRLLLAKNPAGWAELIALLESSGLPLVVGINARAADGHDPSWLWDVEFERLQPRFVVATGERHLDLAVRLRHAELVHASVASQIDALRAAGTDSLDYVGNYTAFQELRRDLRRSPRASSGEAVAPVHESPAVRTRRDRVGQLSIVVVHPDLLGTYGDAGNGRVLANRARWRGVDAEFVLARSDEPLPASGDLYLLGGGEDGPQVRSAEVLSSGALRRAVDDGAAVLAVCAGFQILGTTFPGTKGTTGGVGLIDAETLHTNEHRAVGEAVVDVGPDPSWPVVPGRLSGFENHQARTRLGPGLRPLGTVRAGVGNGFGHVDGAVQGRVFATYLHGPVLARNPAFADLLLSLATGSELPPLGDEEEEALRKERLARARLRR